MPRREKCYCENMDCAFCNGDGCDFPASRHVTCQYIGAICDTCACYMPVKYLGGDIAGWLHEVRSDQALVTR